MFIWPGQLAVRLTSMLCGRNFNVGHFMQTSQPIFFISAILLGTIDFYHLYHFHWPWPCLPLAKSVQSKIYSFSRTLFIWSGLNLMWRWSNSYWTSWDCFRVRFIETRKITCVKQTASINFHVGVHLNVYVCIWFKLGMMIDTIVLYIFMLV